MRRKMIGLICWMIMIASGNLSIICAQNDAQEAFFETRIRPLLIEHCYECHSQEAANANHLKGGLRLDSAEAIEQGGDSGPAINRESIDESLILTAVRYEELEMPPDGKLPEKDIADLRQWIESGAFHSGKSDPNSHRPRANVIDPQQARQKWPYSPLTPSTTLLPSSTAWTRSPIDAFLLAQALSTGIQPAAEAEKRILVRRLYYDLHGLPPTPQQLGDFLNDQEPDAYERLVDRLLADPQFGVRWGRHWLDIVRYAESTTLRGLIYADAWRYRDYIIQSFQEDRPLDLLIREQIAGDLLPYITKEDQSRGLIATTFLALGNHNLEEQDKQQLRMDVVDEQLDVIGQAFLGQTIGCARCHDHKFDPIPTRDYYAMAGILRNVQTLQDANVSNWLTRPLPLNDEAEKKFSELQTELASTQATIKSIKADLARIKPATDATQIELNQLAGVVVDDSQTQRVGEWISSQFTKPFVGSGYMHDDNKSKGEKTITFATADLESGMYEVRLAYSHAESRASKVPITIACAEGEKTVYLNQRLKPDLVPGFVSLGSYRFEKGGQAYVLISTADTDGFVTADAIQFLPAGTVESLSKNISQETSASISPSENNLLKAKLVEYEQRQKELERRLKERPQAMSVLEREKIEDGYVNIRGVVHSKGETVPRGFLQVAPTSNLPQMPTNQSGRLELANWLTAPEHPLTSRVLANRIWTWLMGAGLARNPDHIASSSEAPVHPELIDFLALQLQQDQWSLKTMVRRLVLSSSYRQSSRSEASETLDPDNRYWMRSVSKPLTAEAVRDSILQTSGLLDHAMFGNEMNPLPAADYGYQQQSYRRSTFLPMLRNSLPKILVAFDMADSSRVTGLRHHSIVSPQALLMLNSEEIVAYASNAANCLLKLPLASDLERLHWAFNQTLGRAPSEAEEELFLKYIQANDVPSANKEKQQLANWQDVYQTLFGTAEFRSLE